MKSSRIIRLYILVVLALVLFTCISAFGRAEFSDRVTPQSSYRTAASTCREQVEVGVHNVGRIGLTVVNMGHLGRGFLDNAGASLEGDVPSCTYPYPGRNSYLFCASFWIGAIVGRDTLVSVGADGWHSPMEMWPAPDPEGQMVHRSITDPNDGDAISEQDIISVYVDTVTDAGCTDDDDFDNRPHVPLNIRVTQRSYAWSYSYAEDFVLFDYSIENIGRKKLNQVYMGVYVDADVGSWGVHDDAEDDICGFRQTTPAIKGCPGQDWLDTINIAWISDNDGKRSGGDVPPCPDGLTLPALTGTRIVRTPNADTLKYSFNWWISNPNPNEDWGPRMQPTVEEPWRDFGTGGFGTPMGDRNKYYIMSNDEFDYDQLFTALDHTGEGWLPPPNNAAILADGYDTRYLLSFGPFDIQPGELLPISFAYVAGDEFHHDCEAFDELFEPNDADKTFYNQLDFSDFGKNSVWASWIYDNPGVDTDGDDFKGPKRFCYRDSVLVCDTIYPDTINCYYDYIKVDTIYTAGDGIPDFQGASPPPPPEMWIINKNGDTLSSKVTPRLTETSEGELQVRWNGRISETTKDRFSDRFDFEGYRVYMSLAPDPDQFYVVTSYDIEDYNRYTWNGNEWELVDIPFSLDSLKKLYGQDFEPLDYDIDNIFKYVDNGGQEYLYYFNSQDYNNSDLSNEEGIHKVYPDEPPPSTTDLDSARIYYPSELTEDGLFFKYYEYEYVFKHLLPAQLYFVSVTAFDYGSPGELASLETPAYRNYVAEYAANNNTVAEQRGLEVIVYPNPWRIDGNYREFGFEGRNYVDGPNEGTVILQTEDADERTRGIHFLNLPHRCTIRIFTIDGDLVREIEHDYPRDSPRSMHERWDLITRNTQPAVSGIYYYSVESEYGNQVGKIVIIM